MAAARLAGYSRLNFWSVAWVAVRSPTYVWVCVQPQSLRLRSWQPAQGCRLFHRNPGPNRWRNPFILQRDR